MKEIVLVCGASGLIGKSLVPLLIKNGYTVRELSSNPNKRDPREGVFYWNIEDGELDYGALDGVNVIIYLSGASISKRWTPAHKKAILVSRGRGLDLLRSTLKKKGLRIQQLISASAIGIYPDDPEHLWTESDPLEPSEFLEKSVRDWEESINAFAEVSDKVCALRTSIVLDKMGGALPRMVQAVRLFASAPFGSGRQWMPWISLKDISSLYLFALENRLEGTYNAVCDNVRNKDLMRTLSRVHHRPYWPVGIPKFILRIILGENGVLPYISTRVDSSKIRSTGFSFGDADLEVLLKEQK